MSSFLNEKPFEHTSSHGMTFKGTRCDFKDGVKVYYPSWKISQAQMCSDFAEFAAWHALQIWKELNGFQGYDCINYEYVNKMSNDS